MNIIINDGIGERTLQNLADAYNDLEEKGGSLNIFLESQGGSVAHGEAMIELINRYAQGTTLTAFGLIASMGFKIFAEAQCQKKVLDSAYAICHLSRWNSEVLEGCVAADDFAKFKERKMKKILNKSLKFYEELGFKEEELTCMKQGKDVHLDSDRLKKMFK